MKKIVFMIFLGFCLTIFLIPKHSLAGSPQEPSQQAYMVGVGIPVVSLLVYYTVKLFSGKKTEDVKKSETEVVKPLVESRENISLLKVRF